MESIVITIHPSQSDDALLGVTEALRQIVDVVRLCEEAGRAVSTAAAPVEWRLVRASTNSPLAIEITATAPDPTFDETTFVRRVRRDVIDGMNRVASQEEPPPWMDKEAAAIARNVFARMKDGVGLTEVGNGNGQTVRLDPKESFRAIENLDLYVNRTAVSVGANEEEAWGEIQGVFSSVTFWYRQPAIRIWVEQYNSTIPCILSAELEERFGKDHTLSDVWDGKTLAVAGRLIYKLGKLTRIVVETIREVPTAPRVDLDKIRDPSFTGGLDPVVYLERFRDGELAR